MRKPKKRGATSKMTPAVVAGIARDIRLGLPMKYAAARNGIHQATVCRWVDESREFRETLEAARADRAASLLKSITVAAVGKGDKPGEWQAALRLLEKVEPIEFGVRVRVHVDAELEAALERLHAEFKNESDILERALLAISGGEGGARPLVAETEAEE